ncbi:RDD family protein [Nakamurella sp. A5-74]|uniref:RDD family protein n=1 Tax=Nakamurella sp. A5-74 TaxID=3158264 RepID=A0AAU8DW40_9ACTN
MSTRAHGAAESDGYPGERFALPESGVGSVASTGRRVSGFLLDLLVTFLIALLFTRPQLPSQTLEVIVWAIMTVVFVGVIGSTPGHAIVGVRVARVDGRALVGLWAIPRAALTFVLIPTVIVDADGRGLHDRLCRTIVILSR